MSKKNQKASGGGKKSSLAILLMMLIAVGACALAGYTFYEMKNMKAGAKDDAPAKVKNAAPAVPVYVQMDTFTVSLKPEANDSDRVLYIGLTLRVKDAESKSLLEEYMPEVRSRLLILLAHQTATDISSDEGKTGLTEKIKETVSKPLAPNHSAVVTDVLFNAFILR
ncbi:flagellar basal body-associated protein FliL [Rahnella bonaserana]|jgi:flagellar FliL protein|uniref:Flagellar protein FliL n=1 Tax=Rahnella bonaserana TaxID=2816248 RepID=A0ABS6LR11_9GAMM|nr:flagellar basal body-associated protein FliL [Rahnella bonaserana]MBU9854078.1 flagellar basal body-associated protein FliL [Rahnella bonaserana]WHZ41350.1 flagellar basal body-associated protein FliL [Rahnella bonaserana]